MLVVSHVGIPAAVFLWAAGSGAQIKLDESQTGADGSFKSNFDISSLEMTATGLYDIPTGDNGLTGIMIEPTAQLHALQQAIIDAVNIYARKGEGESAFVPYKSGTPFDPMLFEYVDTFVSHQTERSSIPT